MKERTIKGLILIPARYNSQRFPGKPLVPINGRPLIEHVYSNCRANRYGWDVAVVTDDDKIETHLKNCKANVLRVDDDCRSGTERIFLAYERFYSGQDLDCVLNVQGDEPLLKADHLDRLIEFHQSTSYDVATLVRPIEGQVHEFQSPDRVKVIFNPKSSECHYFSRGPIPYQLDGPHWHLHIGVYSYRVECLKKFSQHPPGRFEMKENLEQLRLYDLSFRIGAVEVSTPLIGVDRPEDISKVEELMHE